MKVHCSHSVPFWLYRTLLLTFVLIQFSNAVIKEAMRLHPAVAFPLERFVPPEGAVLCGVRLPGGTNVSMAAPVIHQDKSVFGKDAEAFRPERWLDNDQDKVKLMDKCFLAVSLRSNSGPAVKCI